MTQYVTEMMTDILKQRELLIVDQLNDLIANNVLLLIQTQPVLTRAPNEDKIIYSQGIKLTFRGAEEMAALRKENAELRERLNKIETVIRDNNV